MTGVDVPDFGFHQFVCNFAVARPNRKPPNSILNYLYAVLETEARLAAAAIGLDPQLGVLHADQPSRDSLALDILEPVRTHIDSYVIDFLSQPLSTTML